MSCWTASARRIWTHFETCEAVVPHAARVGNELETAVATFYFWEDLNGLQKVDRNLKLIQENLVLKIFDVRNLLSAFYFQKRLVQVVS